MLINQAHPKILSRIRMGVDLAKEKFIRGEPFILEVCFLSECLFTVLRLCGQLVKSASCQTSLNGVIISWLWV